ncbi:hypothetical protein OTSKATO_1470 [Orientia tsutsugamushi str. Kato PP]|uniref:Uncharacterized protein n=2 Tax=Orientia tsutsugamushi TaxID=784 RepID=A0A2U3R3N3_ORITS|nr:hypothetical protein OTSKATO_1470 [Orientia tsutsugamushi str. Kato PP]SPR07834.1 Uncharacterised protein [Orientia tsutsugamushi]
MQYIEFKSTCMKKLNNLSIERKRAQQLVKFAKINLQNIQKKNEEYNKKFLAELVTDMTQGYNDDQKIKCMESKIEKYSSKFKSLMQKDQSGSRSKDLDYVTNEISECAMKVRLAFEEQVVKYCGEENLINDWDM